MDDLDLIMFTLDKWKNEQLQARFLSSSLPLSLSLMHPPFHYRARRQYDKQNAKNARALKIQQDLRTKKGLPGSLIGLHDFEYYDAEKYEGAHDDAQSCKLSPVFSSPYLIFFFFLSLTLSLTLSPSFLSQ